MKFLKESSESLQCEVELHSHQINYSVSFKIPVGSACCVIANSHRLHTNAFSGNCLCNNELLVGKWIGFSQATHLIPFMLILMEKFPVSFVGADPVQGCGKLGGWVCLKCKVSLSASVLVNFVPSGLHNLLGDSFEHTETSLWLEVTLRIEHWEYDLSIPNGGVYLWMWWNGPGYSQQSRTTWFLTLWHAFYVCQASAASFMVHEKLSEPLRRYSIFYGFSTVLHAYIACFYVLCYSCSRCALTIYRTGLWQCHTHSRHLLRIQVESFSAFSSSTTMRWFSFFFSAHLCFVDTLPHLKKHTISFNQFNQFVVNESGKKLPDHKRPSDMSWAFQSRLLLFNERSLSSCHLTRYAFLQSFTDVFRARMWFC